MSELSQDEVAVLLIAKQGQSMIPIGRWEKPTLDLAAKGLLRRADAVNYFITDKGLQAIQQRDDEDFRRIKEAQDNLLVKRGMVVQEQIETVVNVVEPLCEQCQTRTYRAWYFCAHCGYQLRGKHG